MLQQLQQYLRTSASRGRDTSRVGPFLLTVSPATDHPFLNYAIPDDGARPGPEEVEALAAAMRAAGRMPRLEYLERSAPDVLGALLAAGFLVELRPPAMLCTTPAAVPLPEGYRIDVPGGREERRALLEVQAAAFGQPPGVEDAEVDRSEASRGGVLAIFEADGELVGGGVSTDPAGSGFTELGGIAVALAHRRRGLAAALTAELTRRAMVAGVRTAYLTPGDEVALRAYERAGFTSAGHVLHVRRE